MYGNPNYRFNPLLADLSAHVRMMDKAGIDVAVLSCGSGFDQPNLATCRLINDRMHQAEQDHPGRFIGLAHVPALNSRQARAELKRCAIELGFPGIVIASELQGQWLLLGPGGIGFKKLSSTANSSYEIKHGALKAPYNHRPAPLRNAPP